MTRLRHDGTIREKYNVVSGNADVQVSTGYKTNEIGFGWTNAVYLKMKEIVASQTREPSQQTNPTTKRKGRSP